MHQPVRPCSARHRQRMIDLLVSWLLVGSGLLLARLLPPYSVLLGWSPAFWLVLAPLTMLLALDPGWGLPWLTRRWSRRRRRASVWN